MSTCTPTHTGPKFQLIGGTLVVIAQIAFENDGTILLYGEEFLGLSVVGDDLR